MLEKNKLWTLPKVNDRGFKRIFLIIPFCECCSAALRKVVSVGIRKDESLNIGLVQGGRTWQPFVGGKNGNENFRQARSYNFRDKCVVLRKSKKCKLNSVKYAIYTM